MPAKCPHCGCEQTDWFTAFVGGPWRVQFRCGHLIEGNGKEIQSEPRVEEEDD